MNHRNTTDLVVTGLAVVEAEGFDHRTALGRRGYKYLPLAAQYFLAAARRAQDGPGEAAREATDPRRRAATVGTNSAAVALHAAMDRTVLEAGADDLSPLTAPYFSINTYITKLAVEQSLKGFNITCTSPRTAGVEALETGVRSLAAGRADWLLAGATEAGLPPGAPGAAHSEAGAVALVLERAEAVAARGGTALGRLAARTFFLPPRTAAGPDGARRAADRIAEALAALGHPEDGDAPVTAVLDDSPVGRAVAAALGDRARPVPAGAGCLAPLRQLAGQLTAGPGPRAVVTAAAEGNVGVCVTTAAAPGEPAAAPEERAAGRPATAEQPADAGR
ncbi:3-oxoacyl-ACP synthase [Streptomyces pactum]|uniref:3-oxoacyl-ACP synthase n=1 Tax=Streptomyces pactum TaxID=68249 RepID=A0ABS0NIP8_9ACTN|nr:beta-ketoacyl synthase N-terminal-like domain-containing protein [Streptomyces pactum]MBH5335060.1 3-oxoacyl-ACP synthase [Streptomyces pactum]